MAKVLIPTALQAYAGGQDELEAEGITVGEVLADLMNSYPNLKKHLYSDNGELRHFVNVYKGSEDTRSLDGMSTPISEDDELSIVPSIAGGVSAPPKKPTPLHPPIGVIDGDRSDRSELDNEEIMRYSRHLILPEVNMEGQKKLKAAKVLCIGAGGLGSPLALYLAAAGVGTIGIVDFDTVDYSNLQRQIIHGTKDVGRLKMESAKESIADINPYVNVIGFEEMLSSDNALDIIRQFDIVIDGTDNFPTRYLVNDACVLLGKPNVYGSIFRFEGQASVFWADHGPCYRCLYPEPPPPGLVPSCAEGGVLGVLPGIVGCLQANEAIKLILGVGNPLIGRLLLFNALKMQFRELRLQKDPDCPICGTHKTITELIDYEQFCGIRGEETETVPVEESQEISAKELKSLIDAKGNFTLIDVREPHEYAIGRIPGSVLVPLGQVEERSHEFDKDSEIILHCKSGKRSSDALRMLQAKGFTHLKNLTGGILAWSDQVDPTVPKY